MTAALGKKLQYWPHRDAIDVLEYAKKSADIDLNSVLDFGCGPGAHRDLLSDSGLRWLGINYARDGKKNQQYAVEEGQYSYDGTRLPWNDQSFDMIWSWQSLEHVIQPEVSFSEIRRCLKNGGIFCGSVSFMEPYHGFSTFNYTPIGFDAICERHKLEVLAIVPYTDGLTLTIRTLMNMLGVPKEELKKVIFFEDGGFFAQSLRKKVARHGGGDHEYVSALAQFCGHFNFVCKARP